MKDVIAWWSGGVTSAVACKIAIDLFGIDRVRVIMIDTKNESDDTYIFKDQCQSFYGVEIETISAIPEKYASIEEVWISTKSLNVATGAICSTKLKREVRERWEKKNSYSFQIFGYEFTKREFNRALGLTLNHPTAKSIYPLLMYGYDKIKCIDIVANEWGLKIPDSYLNGYHNNNCQKTGCVQGGIGYWKKIQKEGPNKFLAMANREHLLSGIKGKPVTILRDNTKAGKEKEVRNVFLIKNPMYPDCLCLDDLPDAPVKPLLECNGFCGVDDLMDSKDKTWDEIAYELD